MTSAAGYSISVAAPPAPGELSAERRIRMARLWREVAVGHLERARAYRHEGDTRSAAEWEEAAADWAAAAEQLEWQLEQRRRPADEDQCGGRNTLTRMADADYCTPLEWLR